MNTHHTPRVGDIAPTFTLPTQRGVQVSLSETLRDRTAVAVTIAFVGRVTVGGRETPAGRRILALTNDLPRMRDNGVSLLVIVPNRRDEAKRYVEEVGTPFHLLCDEDGTVARQYGLDGWTWGRWQFPWAIPLRRDIRPALIGINRDGRVGFCQIGEWAGKTGEPDAP